MIAYPVSLRSAGIVEWESLVTGERTFRVTQDPKAAMGGKDFAHRLRAGGRWEAHGLYPEKRSRTSWAWPLLQDPEWPPEQGQFAAVRTYDVHTGVDLHCPEGTGVVACEDGEVISIEKFTGLSAGSPWWNETQAVLVRGASGTICYGEIAPEVKVGDTVRALEAIGYVRRVLKADKGLPTSMLHIERYTPECFTETVVWPLGKKKPKGLQDPTPYLRGTP